MEKRHIVAGVPVALLTALLTTVSAPAFAADSFSEAFTEGKFGYSFRWRLENVDQDFPASSGNCNQTYLL